MREVEVRAVIENPEKIEKELRKRKFKEIPKVEQLDIIFDTPNASLFRSGRKIRIRTEGDFAEITYKGAFIGDSSASRRTELNIPIKKEQIPMFSEFLSALGYPFCFQIPKSRKKFVGNGITVTLDNWPIIGCMIEIEGEEKKVKTLASEIAPDVEFKNYRLKELFQLKIKKTGKSFDELKKEFELKTGKN